VPIANRTPVRYDVAIERSRTYAPLAGRPATLEAINETIKPVEPDPAGRPSAPGSQRCKKKVANDQSPPTGHALRRQQFTVRRQEICTLVQCHA